MPTIDILIIGQGLAGSLLAFELLQRGYRVLVVDNGQENASQVAAGLINPVTGLRLVKTPDVEVLLPVAKACYQQLADLFGQTFYVEMPMWRLLRDDKALTAAQRRLQQCDYHAYLQAVMPTPPMLNAPQGILLQQQTGYLRTVPLLNCLKNYLQQRQSYQCAEFDYAALDVARLQWQSIRARHIVFCEGYRAMNNPWFKHLPFQPAKGEILTAETASPLPQAILNYGHWLIPLANGRFKSGATFDPQPLNQQTTPAARQVLLDALAQVFPSLQPVTLIKQQAGIRPATLDKNPFIGTHPRLQTLHSFNGFGAKGSLSMPHYAQCFANYLQRQTPLPANCDIVRYDATHFPD